jgi:hypothetical protein
MIAAAGLRVCVDELSSVEVPKLKSGKDGKPKVVYADLAEAERWMWKFVDGAKTAGELYGRALVVLWAAHYALDEVLPHGERRGRVVEDLLSYDDKLIKILERLGKRHLPAQLTRLRRAIALEANAYRKAKDELAAEAARHRHLQTGYLADELDERGWPKPEAHQALIKRQRIADRDKALANGGPRTRSPSTPTATSSPAMRRPAAATRSSTPRTRSTTSTRTTRKARTPTTTSGTPPDTRARPERGEERRGSRWHVARRCARRRCARCGPGPPEDRTLRVR